jgi:hypothetical protein
VTPLGVIIAVLGFQIFLASRRWTYRLFLFSIPFSGTSVLNVGNGDSASGVQVWMYFGALLLLRDLVTWLLNPNASLAVSLLKRSKYLGLFTLILATSLVMPVYIDGRLQIASPLLTDLSSSPLYFSSRNVTALLYVVFGSMLAISIARRNIDAEDVMFTEKTYLQAGILTCTLGALEFIAHLVHFPSPTLLFRNSASPGAGGYLGLLEGMARVSSVATEPSILAQYLCTVLPLTMPAVLGKGFICSRRVDRWAFYLFLTTFVLTLSSVAYGILVLSPILCLPVISRLGIKTAKAAWYSLLCLLTVSAGIGVLYFISSTARQVLNAALFSKGESYSSLERLKTISWAWEYFKQYPVLGVGWGSVTSHDLIAMILANSGLLGLVAFVLILFGIARPILHRMNGKSDGVSLSRGAWLLSGVLLIASSVLSGFPFVFGFFWIVIAMGIAAGSSNYLKKADLTTAGTLRSQTVTS